MTLSSSDTRVGELNHIGIAVMNIEKSLEQFYELFDSPEASILVNHEHAVRGAFIEQGETLIELLEPLNATSVIAKFLETHGEGIHHMAFTVGNVDTKVSELQKLGISIITGPREGFTGRIAFTNPTDTHGILIELVTPFNQSHNE